MYERLFRFMHVFEYQSTSKLWRIIHGPIFYLFIGAFPYGGGILLFLSLTTSESVIQVSQVLFIGAVWVNIWVKETIFILKKRKLVELWQQLGDDDFRAKTKNEFQLVLSFYPLEI